MKLMDILNINDVVPLIEGKKVVFVTGVTGQDGSHMADYLLTNTDYFIVGGARRLSIKNHENIKHPIADLPMNAAFWGVVEKNMTRGEIRELFLGDKGASKKQELQYIPGDPSFMGWQQMLMQIEQGKMQQKAQKEQAAAQQQQLAAQQQQEQQKAELEQQKHSRDKEKHDADMAEIKGKAAYNAIQHGQREK